jgi:LysM repeat protein
MNSCHSAQRGFANPVASVLATVAAIFAVAFFGGHASPTVHQPPVAQSAAAIVAGQQSALPASAAPAPQIYIVQRGDTLSGIAQQFGVSMGAVLAANGLSRHAVLHPGDRLVIPPSQSPTSQDATRPSFVKSAVSSPNATVGALTASSVLAVSGTASPTPIDPPSAPVASASAFVTQDQFNAGLSAIGQSLRQLISESASNPVVSGAGAPLSVEAFAPSQAIDQLSGVTITNANLTASEIPTDIVASNYLPLSGGTLTGPLTVPTLNASSTIFGGFTATNATTTNFFSTNGSTTNATSTNLFASLGNFTTAIANTFNASVANIVGLTATNATTTNLAIASVPSSILSTNTNGTVQSTTISSPLSLSGNTLSLPQANGSTNGYLASSDWTTFNTKLASSSLATSALLAGLISDHTGSGALVFANSPTFSGTPTFAGGAVHYSVNSTTTIPDNTPYAWTIATSTTGTPLLQVDTTAGAEQVIAGYAGADVTIGAVGAGSNLVFQENSAIEGAGTGRTLTFGANNDMLVFTRTLQLSIPDSSTLMTNNGNTFLVSSSTSGLLTLGEGAGAALIATSTTAGNTVFGYNALNTATSSAGDTAIGYKALFSEITSAASGIMNNTAVGFKALVSNTSGSNNVAVGGQALYSNTTGKNNVGFGASSLSLNTTGANDTAIGNAAMQENTGGSNNVAIGNVSTQYNTTGSNNSSVGARSLDDNTTGSSNVAFGFGASQYDVSATNTVAVGYQAGNGNSISYNNQGSTLLGYQAGFNFSNGSNYNTFLGYEAGNNLTTGADNILIGAASTTANDNLTTGSQNVKIGDNISLPSATASGQLNIQNIIFGTGNTGIGTSVSTGNIGIGTTTPGSLLSVGNTNGINFSTATSTFSTTGGINLAAGCFAVGGNCLALNNGTLSGILPIANGGTGNSSSISGLLEGNGTSAFTGITGTAGEFPYYNGTNTLLATSSLFMAANGNVGINNPSPAYALDVVGFINVDANSGFKQAGNPIVYASSTNLSTLVGQAAPWMTSTSTVIRNTAVGYEALNATPTSGSDSDNTAVGYNALLRNTTGGSNVALGDTSLWWNTAGNNNAAFGVKALYNNNTGSQNIGFGTFSLYYNTTGGSNTAVGYQSSYRNDSATNTVAIGGDAAYGNNISYNAQGYTAIGFASGYNLTTGSDYNTLLGFDSGYGITTGNHNLFLGDNSTQGNASETTGSSNIKIGDNITLPSGTASNQLDIGSLIFGTGINGQGMTVSTGNIGIGITNPSSRLTVQGPDTSGSTASLTITNSTPTTEFQVFDNGSATLAGTLTQSSDQRLKTNIQSLNASSSLAAIDALNPVTFNWIDPSQGSTTQLGFIAQQVQPIFPTLVSTTSPTALTPNGTLGLNYINLVSPIVSAIQALDQELTDLSNTVAGFAQSITTQLLTAATGNFQRINANELCLGSTCVTETQLQALLAAANQSASAPSSPSPSSSTTDATDTPPIIQINGDNPAIIQVGASYTDLGAINTRPQADLNLGVATDTIDYVVTDQDGLTSTSTRTIIIQAANDNQASSTPANDNEAASSSPATTTSQ